MTVIVSSTASEATVLFGAFLPWAYMAIGITVAVTVIVLLVNVFQAGLDRLLHGHRRHTDYEHSSEGQYRKAHHETVFD